MQPEKFMELLEQFYRISYRMNKNRNIPLRFDGTVPVNTAAIHLLETVGKHENCNLTEIAEMLDITKGAVSQMATKLEKENLISRHRNGTNDKDIFFSLTEEGRRVFDGHEILHQELSEKLQKVFARFDDRDIDNMKLVLDEIESCMIRYNHF